MENVICSCVKCKEELGCFRNAWNGIGNTYFSPIFPPASTLDGFVPTHSIYKGTEQTHIENSYLQDVACKGCGAVLGLRCDSAPEGHMLKRNQLILRLTEMSIVSERTGHKANVSVIERFPLTLPGATKPPRSRRASTVQPSYGAGTPSLMNHRPVSNSILPPIVEKQLQELDKFKDWAKTAIETQQNDVDRIGGAFDPLERDMVSFKAFVEEVRTELATYRQFQENLKDEELRVIKQDLFGIRAELNANRQFKNSLREEEFPVLQEDIHALRSELAEAQRFQRELKQQDIQAVQRDVNGLRQKLESMANLTEDDPKLTHEEFEILVDDVREVDRKVGKINILRTELEQFKARLACVETSVQNNMIVRQAERPTWKHLPDHKTETISQRESRIPGHETSQVSIRKYMQQIDPSSHEQEERRAQSLPKRRYLELENNEGAYNPPSKRPMHSTTQTSSILSSGNGTSKSLTVRFRTGGSPIILSSNHGTPSPVLDRYSFHSTQNRDGAKKSLNNGPMPVNDLQNLNDTSRSSREPLARGDIISSKAQLRSGTSIPVHKRAIDISPGASGVDTVSRSQNHSTAHKNSVQKSKERSHPAVRIAPSKQMKKPRHFRERSDTPDQLSTPFADQAMQKSVQKRVSGSSKIRNRSIFDNVAISPMDSDSPLPSIEDGAEQGATKVSMVIPSIPSPPSGPSIDADPERPFACDGCGKTYKFIGNLERHKIISIRCRVEEGAVKRNQGYEDEIIKKRKIRERERLAAELLAKQ